MVKYNLTNSQSSLFEANATIGKKKKILRRGYNNKQGATNNNRIKQRFRQELVYLVINIWSCQGRTSIREAFKENLGKFMNREKRWHLE